jgi:hypothetical protein
MTRAKREGAKGGPWHGRQQQRSRHPPARRSESPSAQGRRTPRVATFLCSSAELSSLGVAIGASDLEPLTASTASRDHPAKGRRPAHADAPAATKIRRAARSRLNRRGRPSPLRAGDETRMAGRLRRDLRRREGDRRRHPSAALDDHRPNVRYALSASLQLATAGWCGRVDAACPTRGSLLNACWRAPRSAAFGCRRLRGARGRRRR